MSKTKDKTKKSKQKPKSKSVMVLTSDDTNNLIRIGVHANHVQSTVVLEFNMPVTGLALPPELAARIGETLIEKAQRVTQPKAKAHVQ